MLDANDSCPICKRKSRRLFERHGYWIRECGSCGHQLAELRNIESHVDRIYTDSYFHGKGAGYPDYLAESEILIAHGERYARMLKQYMKGGRLLDIGSAAGFILKGFVSYGWQAVGIEPNHSMAAYGRAKLGLDIKAVRFEDYSDSGTFDLVCMIQVISHFVDIRNALAGVAERTRPGGYWLIETWDRDSLVAKLLGSSWHEYSPPSVVHWFSKRSLRDLIEEYGFQEIASGRPHKVIGLNHALSLLKYKFRNGPLKLLFNGMSKTGMGSLGIPYIFGDIFWGLYQKTLDLET
jgi:SAM-dependent methyltransferase